MYPEVIKEILLLGIHLHRRIHRLLCRQLLGRILVFRYLCTKAAFVKLSHEYASVASVQGIPAVWTALSERSGKDDVRRPSEYSSITGDLAVRKLTPILFAVRKMAKALA